MNGDTSESVVTDEKENVEVTEEATEEEPEQSQSPEEKVRYVSESYIKKMRSLGEATDSMKETINQPGPLSAHGKQVDDIIASLKMMTASSEEGGFPFLDDSSITAVVSHSLGALMTLLPGTVLKDITTRIVSETSMWVCRLFRFFEGTAFFHEDPREGLVRICRMVLHLHYPRLATGGFEALYSRPPVIYVSSAGRSGLGQYLAHQLGLPLTSLSIIPCNSSFGSQHAMDVAAFEKLVSQDLAAQRTPLLVLANAGTPLAGHVDNLTRLQEICSQHNIWLHVGGPSLAALSLVSTSSLPAKVGDSFSVPLGTWLGVPAMPCATLYKASDASAMHQAGLSSVNLQLKLVCLPLWICLQQLGIQGVTGRIEHSLQQALAMYKGLSNLSGIQMMRSVDTATLNTTSLVETVSNPINAEILFDLVPSIVTFRFCPESEDLDGNKEKVSISQEYRNNLNSWLGQIVQRDKPHVPVELVSVDGQDVCLRYSPFEAAFGQDLSLQEIHEYIDFIKEQVAILLATVRCRSTFEKLVTEHERLAAVTMSNWVGLGAARYIPQSWMGTAVTDLPDSGKEEINRINKEIVMHLRGLDAAFSRGESSDGLACVQFGMVTEETDVSELIDLAVKVGADIEEASKYIESMTEIVKKGIETAETGLKKENEEKIWQEGILRKVPVVGSVFNWLSPQAQVGVKGRSLSLTAGVVESTENIYKYHMQIAHGKETIVNSKSPPEPSVKTPVVSTPEPEPQPQQQPEFTAASEEQPPQQQEEQQPPQPPPVTAS